MFPMYGRLVILLNSNGMFLIVITSNYMWLYQDIQDITVRVLCISLLRKHIKTHTEIPCISLHLVPKCIGEAL